MKIKLIPRSKIFRYPENPRKNAAGLAPVKKSIEEFGFVQPVVLDRENVIIIGHTRYDATEGDPRWTSLPCLIVDLPPDRVRALRIADNSTHEFSTWDHDKLMAELHGLRESGAAMQDFFNGFDVAAELAKMDGAAPPPAPPGKTVVFNYKPQFGVIVVCDNGAAQEKAYNELTGRGYTCKVVTT